MAAAAPKEPVVMIIGATGTGKSKLAVELATRFNGEVINCDAMQMYKGLPIITNKIPDHERNGIPHHLLDIIDVRENLWTVQEFVKETSRIIDEIRSRGKLPVIVGGTIYYTYSLLFKDAILPTSEKETPPEEGEGVSNEDEFPILSASTEEIFRKLQEVDPEMAKKWHPNDRRKIRRSLEIWLRSGRKASEIYAEQRATMPSQRDNSTEIADRADIDTASVSNLSLRYPSLLLWLEAEDAVLKRRLNARVESMVENGLCDEVLDMAILEREMKKQEPEAGLDKGILVSIGYKELQPWVEARGNSDSDPVKTAKILQGAIESVKASTRRYAKRQNRFVRIRFAKPLKSAGKLDSLFLLDCTALEKWESAVAQPARDLVQSFLTGSPLPEPKTLSDMASRTLSMIEEDDSENGREARRCEICDKVLMSEKEWQGHLASRSHKKILTWHRRGESSRAKEGENTQNGHRTAPAD